MEIVSGSISGRYMCDILADMRDCHKAHNYSYLSGLIEEAQYRANRMEDRLSRVKDIARYEERRDKLKKEIEELRKSKVNLGGDDSSLWD